MVWIKTSLCAEAFTACPLLLFNLLLTDDPTSNFPIKTSFFEPKESPPVDEEYEMVERLYDVIQSLLNGATEKDFFIPFHKITLSSTV